MTAEYRVNSSIADPASDPRAELVAAAIAFAVKYFARRLSLANRTGVAASRARHHRLLPSCLGSAELCSDLFCSELAPKGQNTVTSSKQKLLII